MFNYKEIGYIYKNKKGQYLVRVINRGFYDRTHYSLHFVDDIQDAMLFEHEIVYSESDIQYRTLFSEDIILGCEKIKVERHTQYLKPCEYKILED